MRSLYCSVLALTFALAAQPAFAQDPDAMMLRMDTAMAEAQAQASRPGDEALSCEALEAEMIALTQDPALQARMVENGAWAQGQVDRMNAQAGRMRAQMGMSMIPLMPQMYRGQRVYELAQAKECAFIEGAQPPG